MSFILESNGQEFCDWRFSISPTCADSAFFFGVQAYSSAIGLLQVAVVIICLSLRLFVLKDPLKSFTYGPNGALFFLLVAMICWVTMSLIALLARNPLAGEISWSLAIPLPYVPLLVYLATLLEAFPEVFISNNQALLSLVSATKTRNIWLGIFLSFMIWTNVGLHVGAAVLMRDGNVAVGSQVAQAATIIITINVTLFICLFVYVSRHFLSMISRRMVSVQEDSKSKDKEVRARLSMMEIINKKIRTNIYSAVFNSILLVLYHILLSAYPEFFSNLPFSKAMAVIFVAMIPSASAPMVVVYLLVDIQRIRRKWGGGSSVKTRTNTQGKSQPTKDVEIEEIIEKSSSELPLEPKLSEAAMNSFLSNVGGEK